MNPTFQVIRAVAASFAKQVYIPVVIIAACLFAVAIGLSIWLTTLSAWWWLLFALFMLWGIVLGLALLIAGILIKILSPEQTKQQKRQVRAFVEKLQSLSDVVQTPKFILLFRLVRDIARPRKDGFVSSVSLATTTLRSDFSDLVKSFS